MNAWFAASQTYVHTARLVCDLQVPSRLCGQASNVKAHWPSAEASPHAWVQSHA
jgi:hypothetical protein